MDSDRDTTDLFYKKIVEEKITEAAHRIEFKAEIAVSQEKTAVFKLTNFYICTIAGGKLKRKYRKILFDRNGISPSCMDKIRFDEESLEFIDFLKNIIYIDSKRIDGERYFNWEEETLLLPSVALDTGIKYVEKFADNYKQRKSASLKSYVTQWEEHYVLAFKNLSRIVLMGNKYVVSDKKKASRNKNISILQVEQETFKKIKYLKENLSPEQEIRFKMENVSLGNILKALGKISKIILDESIKMRVIIPEKVEIKLDIKEEEFIINNERIRKELIIETEFLYDGKIKEDYGSYTVLQNETVENSMTAELNKTLSECGFEKDNGIFFLKNDKETLYNFMTKYLSVLSSQYKVVLAKNIKYRRYEKIYPEIKVTVGKNIRVEFSVNNVIQEEVADIIDAAAMKEKYYENDSGGLFLIEETEFAELVELLGGLKATEKEINMGVVIREKSFFPFIKNILKSIYKQKSNMTAERKKMLKKIITQRPRISSSFRILRNYQRKGVNDLLTLKISNFGGILADEFGLGKTLQVIAFLHTCRNEKYNLIIVHSYMLKYWQNEFKKFAPDFKVRTAAGKVEDRAKTIEKVKPDEILLTSYEIFQKDFIKYEYMKFDCIIFDEPLYLKEREEFLDKLAILKAETCYCTTSGFSWENLTDIHYLFELVKFGYLGAGKNFKAKYTMLKNNDEKNMLDLLTSLIHPYLIYRRREEVIGELPETSIQQFTFEMDNNDKYRAVYLSYVQKINKFLLTDRNREKITLKKLYTFLVRLGQICSYPGMLKNRFEEENKKLTALRNILKTAEKEKSKVLVISQFHKNLKMFKIKFSQNINKANQDILFVSKNNLFEIKQDIYQSYNEKSREKSTVLFGIQIPYEEIKDLDFDVVIYFDPPWKDLVATKGKERFYNKKVYEINMILQGSVEEKIYNMKKLLKCKIITKMINMSEKEILKNYHEEITKDEIFDMLQL